MDVSQLMRTVVADVLPEIVNSPLLVSEPTLMAVADALLVIVRSPLLVSESTLEWRPQTCSR